MKNIVVGFSKPKKWKPFAWLIMKGYSIPYDHVYLKFHSDSYDRDIIYQASKTMINFMGTEVFESENYIYREFSISLSEENYKTLMQFAIDNAGKPYSFREAIGLGIARICSFFGKKIENPLKRGNREYVCSVIAAYVLQNYTNQSVPGDFEDADPKFLYELLEKPTSDKA